LIEQQQNQMVKNIKNRIAAFEEMAATSKSSSKILKVEPPSPGFSAVHSMKKEVRAKETSGVVSTKWKPQKQKHTSEATYGDGQYKTYENFKNRLNNNGVNETVGGSNEQIGDGDDGGYGVGPISVVKVQSKEQKIMENGKGDFRDEVSISPLSFLEYHGDMRQEDDGKITKAFTPIDEELTEREENVFGEADLSPFLITTEKSPESGLYDESQYISQEKKEIHDSAAVGVERESDEDEGNLGNALMNYVRAPSLINSYGNQNQLFGGRSKFPALGRSVEKNVDQTEVKTNPSNIQNYDNGSQTLGDSRAQGKIVWEDNSTENRSNRILLLEGRSNVQPITRKIVEENVDQDESEKNYVERYGKESESFGDQTRLAIQVKGAEEYVDETERVQHASFDDSGKGFEEEVDHNEKLKNTEFGNLSAFQTLGKGVEEGHNDTTILKNASAIDSDAKQSQIFGSRNTFTSRESYVKGKVDQTENIKNPSILESYGNHSHVFGEVNKLSSQNNFFEENVDQAVSMKNVEDTPNLYNEIDEGIADVFSDTSPVGAAIEDEETIETVPLVTVTEGNIYMETLPDGNVERQIVEEKISEEKSNERDDGEEADAHEIYEPGIEKLSGSDEDVNHSKGVSAFEKGFQEEIEAFHKAQEEIEALKRENFAYEEHEVILPIEPQHAKQGHDFTTNAASGIDTGGIDHNQGQSSNNGQYRVYPTSLTTRNDDIDSASLGVSVLTEDTYGYEVRMSSKKIDTTEQSETSSQNQGSLPSQKSSPIFRSASSLANNPILNKTRSSISEVSMKSGNSPMIKGRKKGRRNNFNRRASLSTTVVSKSSIVGDNHKTVSGETRNSRDRKSRKKRSSLSSTIRSLSPFRRNKVKDNIEDGSQISRQMSATHSEKTATIDNRKGAKKNAISSIIKSASPFRHRASKNKIPNLTDSSTTFSSKESSRRIGASPRQRKSSRDIMNDNILREDDYGEESPLVDGIVGHEV